MNTETAYLACEEITRREAKNFGYGIRLLRLPERHALSSVYALARRIDDIGDGTAPPADQKLVELARVRDESPSHPGRYRGSGPGGGRLQPRPSTDLPLARLRRADRRLRARRPRHLVRHLRRSRGLLPAGGGVHRAPLARRIRHQRPQLRSRLADDLGVALQLTNILRDVLEDRRQRPGLPPGGGRRVAVGCPPDLSGQRPPRWPDLVAFECARVPTSGSSGGSQLLPLLNHRSRACVGAMAGIYHRLLVHIERDPMAVTQRRLSLPAAEKVWIAGKCIVGARV